MEALIDLSWRTYPATALAVAGLLPALQGGRRLWRGFRPPYADPAKTLDGVQGFRRGIIGLALAGVAGAWIWQQDWLLALSLVIGAEEVLESSLHVRALRMSRDHYRRTRDATTTRPAPAAEEHASPRQHGLRQQWAASAWAASAWAESAWNGAPSRGLAHSDDDEAGGDHRPDSHGPKDIRCSVCACGYPRAIALSSPPAQGRLDRE